MLDVMSLIRGRVETIAKNNNQELIDIELGTVRENKSLHIIVGSENGPGINELTAITREFNKFIEEEQPLNFEFDLEVSSPGLDRPLKTIGDFRRNVGRKIKLTYLDENDSTNVHDQGVIETYDNNTNSVSFELEKNKNITISIVNILKAKLVIEIRKRKKNKKNKNL